MNDPGRILILGAGPTGLGAAWRLQELGFDDYLLLEAAASPGGLASSYVDDAGFTWDVGGHVQFSHYRYYDTLLDKALGGAWLQHERESSVWIRGRFVPFPLQYHIHRLDREDQDRVLAGLERAASANGHPPMHNFREWIDRTFGREFGELFLYPYNFKVWGYPLESLGVSWMGNAVAVPSLERVRRNLRENLDDTSFGPHRTFRFPARGGTGAIWKSVAGLLDADHVTLDARVTAIDLDARQVTLTGGRRLPYDVLITTLPLPWFVAMCARIDPAARMAADTLLSSACHIVGIGIRGPKPTPLEKKCWMYFPDEASPYYRVTVFSNYSPANVPDGDGYWSLMAEVCESSHKPVDAPSLRASTLASLVRDGLLPSECEVVSFWHRREEHGYPTPSLGRDAALAAIRPLLERQRVYSRGRFGAWKYEVSSQDHSCMQGVELAERLLGVGEEVTIDRPEYVNSGAFLKEGVDGRC
jgi:protoporphyrinogen oxidase